MAIDIAKEIKEEQTQEGHNKGGRKGNNNQLLRSWVIIPNLIRSIDIIRRLA